MTKSYEGYFLAASGDISRANGLKLLPGSFMLNAGEKNVWEGGATLKQIAQRDCTFSIPGSLQNLNIWPYIYGQSYIWLDPELATVPC